MTTLMVIISNYMTKGLQNETTTMYLRTRCSIIFTYIITVRHWQQYLQWTRRQCSWAIEEWQVTWCKKLTFLIPHFNSLKRILWFLETGILDCKIGWIQPSGRVLYRQYFLLPIRTNQSFLKKKRIFDYYAILILLQIEFTPYCNKVSERWWLVPTG